MDLRFRSDIDSPRRLIENDHGRIAVEPASQQCLLLVSSAERADGLCRTGGSDVVTFDRLRYAGLLGSSSNHAEFHQPIGKSNTDRLCKRMSEHQSLAFALFGNVDQARRERLACATWPPWLSAKQI